MWVIVMGVFFILHGLVHLLYAGQSGRCFELRPGMTWPDGSWLFSKWPGDEATRLIVSIFLGLTTLGFVSGGLGLFLRQGWWQPVVIGSAIVSGTIFCLFWDGKFQALDDKGGIGLLINLTILVVVLVLKWPA